MRPRVRIALAVAALALGSTSQAARQDAPPPPEQREQESEIDRLLRLSREGKAVVRPQAAQQLVALGKPAAERLLAESSGGPAALAELGPELVEAMGALAEPELRARSWAALADPDFPWRPQAARGLLTHAAADEGPRFLALLDDPLAAVREAGVQALDRLDLRGSEERARALLSDPDDRVRRATARLLFGWGDRCTVAWIFAELARDDRYFELQTGKLARYEALKLLEGQLTGKLRKHFGFDAEKTFSDPKNAEAGRAIEAHVRALCAELPELPPVARPSGATEGDVLGLEVRSCRKGEFFLRWNAADVLYVGTGNPVAIELEPGTVARLMEAAKQRIEPLGEQRLWGSPGCDIEQLHWRAEPGARTTSFRISKGQRAVEGLRPRTIAELERLLLATLPESGDDPRVRDLRARVSDALEAVGGALSTE